MRARERAREDAPPDLFANTARAKVLTAIRHTLAAQEKLDAFGLGRSEPIDVARRDLDAALAALDVASQTLRGAR